MSRTDCSRTRERPKQPLNADDLNGDELIGGTLRRQRISAAHRR